MKAMGSFFEALGLAIVIATLAVSCEYCARHDKNQSVREFIGACPDPEKP